MQFTYKLSIFVFCLGIALTGCAGQTGSAANAAGTGESNPYAAPMPNFSTPVTHKEIRHAFYNYSVVSIVNALRPDHKSPNWDMILDKVQAGDKEWIQTLLSYISPGTDAAASTEVLVSLAYALPNNPQAVLSLAYARGPSLYEVCSLPFIEPEYAFIEDYGKRTLAALATVEEPYYLEPRDMCVRLLQDSLKYCEKLHKEGKWNW